MISGGGDLKEFAIICNMKEPLPITLVECLIQIRLESLVSSWIRSHREWPDLVCGLANLVIGLSSRSILSTLIWHRTQTLGR